MQTDITLESNDNKIIIDTSNFGDLDLQYKLKPKLVFNEDLPFMIREHRRKYEFIISQVSVWRKESN